MARLLIVAAPGNWRERLVADLAPHAELCAVVEPCAAAIERAVRECPDVILVEPNAPLCEELGRVPELAHTSLLVFGDSAHLSEMGRCLEAGASDVIALPQPPDITWACIAVAVEIKALRESNEELRRADEARRRALETTVDALAKSGREVQASARRERYLATHDALTGLPNRRLFLELGKKALSYAGRYGQNVAVLNLDLDHFKSINDGLGHKAGDELLQTVADRMRETLRSSDLVARLAGDEFAILALNLASRDAVGTVAEKLLAKIAEPIVIDGEEFMITPSIGVSVFPGDGESCEALLQHANSAMNLVKERGRASFQFYSRAMGGGSIQRVRLEYNLREALVRGEFLLHYQPQVDAEKGHLVGCEALLRWHNPELGMVSPGEFIQVAENAGLIIEIGSWVIGEACRQKARWRAEGLGDFPVGVNVSYRQFKSGNLCRVVSDALADAGIPARQLDLEITENTIMDDVEVARDALLTLREMGVHISIDDFGTGYSSLAVLGQFPADTLKIDRAFVREIDEDPSRAAITRAVIAVAGELGLETIAEGVETECERDFLRTLGVNQMQGFLFGRPMDPEAFASAWPDGSRTS